jgi:hypothetical protein
MNYNSNGSTDVGLWQINSINWGNCNSGHAPCDPTQNLNCAIKIYQGRSNSWNAWSTHTAISKISFNFTLIFPHFLSFFL